MRSRKMFDLNLLLTALTALTLAWPGMSLIVAAQPANDDFDDAMVVAEPLPFIDFLNTELATTAPDDPDCFGQGPTVWYTYTPRMDMQIEANTFGSDYDTAVSVYSGTRSDLQQIACNDDARGTLQSRASFEAFAGETYFFMVGAYASGPGGNLVFTVQVAPDLTPLTLDLVVDPSGTFQRTGTATISGTVVCSRPVFANLFIELTQEVGRLFVIRGFAEAFVACEGETAWQATVDSESGLFKGGPAKVSTFAFAFDRETGEIVQDSEFAPVRLRGGTRGAPSSATSAELPNTVALEGNYPNPFNPETTLRFSLPDASVVRLAVFDVRGREVQVLIDGSLPAGRHDVSFEARDLPNGIYFSRLEVGGKVLSNRMVLLK